MFWGGWECKQAFIKVSGHLSNKVLDTYALLKQNSVQVPIWAEIGPAQHQLVLYYPTPTPTIQRVNRWILSWYSIYKSLYSPKHMVWLNFCGRGDGGCYNLSCYFNSTGLFLLFDLSPQGIEVSWIKVRQSFELKKHTYQS